MDIDIVLAIFLFLGVLAGILSALTPMLDFLRAPKEEIAFDISKSTFKIGEEIAGTLEFCAYKKINASKFSILLIGTKGNSEKQAEVYRSEQQLEQNKIFRPGNCYYYNFTFPYPAPQINFNAEKTLIATNKSSKLSKDMTIEWKLSAILKCQELSIREDKRIYINNS